ncbi:MAG TPA: hypothetical protein VMO76_08000 [Candidatus Udaeobacter sp.]|jgi:hypothetical protein|nr:hypothetical protein [Candidatus Udaeobacter sp.]
MICLAARTAEREPAVFALLLRRLTAYSAERASAMVLALAMTTIQANA